VCEILQYLQIIIHPSRDVVCVAFLIIVPYEPSVGVLLPYRLRYTGTQTQRVSSAFCSSSSRRDAQAAAAAAAAAEADRLQQQKSVSAIIS